MTPKRESFRQSQATCIYEVVWQAPQTSELGRSSFPGLAVAKPTRHPSLPASTCKRVFLFGSRHLAPRAPTTGSYYEASPPRIAMLASWDPVAAVSTTAVLRHA